MSETKKPTKQPEIIPLPTEDTTSVPRKIKEPPYFLVLNQQKQRYFQAFNEQRRNDRIERIKAIQNKRGSKVIVYYSVSLLDFEDAKILAELLQSIGKQKKLDLFLLSPGGYVDPAFKMAKLCRDFSEEKFSVIIPYYAKSAATLLSLGADELVMGHPSEIGPIDPRIRVKDNYGREVDVSATAIKDALKVIEELSGESPEKSLKYMPLIEKINLDTLGEYERALKASQQYAKTLLETSNLLKDKSKAEDVANSLATGYYSHGYAIYADEARDKLGFNIVFIENEDEWKPIWQLYNLYEAFIDDSKTATQMVTTVFEAEEFHISKPKPLKK
jgi:hypothetical protein